MGTGSWVGGEALTKTQRSRDAAKESCVTASASVADRKSLVKVRVGSKVRDRDRDRDTEDREPKNDERFARRTFSMMFG